MPLLPSPAMEIMGVDIRTIISDNVATRCDGCNEIVEGTPWRVNVLDIVATETPVDWTETPLVNPGPFQFHSDPAHVRRGWRARATCSAAAAKCARSCAPCRSQARTANSACVTASIGTTTS